MHTYEILYLGQNPPFGNPAYAPDTARFMPIRKAEPQIVHSKVKVSKNNCILAKTSHALSSLLDTSEDKQQEPTIDP